MFSLTVTQIAGAFLAFAGLSAALGFAAFIDQRPNLACAAGLIASIGLIMAGACFAVGHG